MFSRRKSRQKSSEQDPGELCAELLDPDDPMSQTRVLHERLIDNYYNDVLRQANASFWCAVILSLLGFLVLVSTIIVVVVVGMTAPDYTFPVGLVGVTSGAVIELLSAAVFFIYKRATDQFNTFHLCLERMNRYLTSYIISKSMANNTNTEQQQLSRDLACIIASAPMITLPQGTKASQTIQPSSEGQMPSRGNSR
jgi:TRADD-N domain-containing protein